MRGKRGSITRLCWEEFKITRQLSTGNGDAWIAQWRIPSWFKKGELGYGEKECITHTLNNLELINARNLATLKARETPPSVPRKRREKTGAMSRRQRRILRSAGIRVVGGRYVDTRKKSAANY